MNSAVPATLAHDGNTITRPAGRYRITITYRHVADNQWYHVAVTEGGTFGLGATELPGWAANHRTWDRAQTEANRARDIFRTGRTHAQVTTEYEAAQQVTWEQGYTYTNLAGVAQAQITVDALRPLLLQQEQYELLDRGRNQFD